MTALTPQFDKLQSTDNYEE